VPTTPLVDPPVLPGAEPLALDRGTAGVLVLHGFTGSPQSVRPWAEHLAEAGFTIRLPLLPGHGRTWQAMAKTGWSDWYATADAALTELVERCDVVYVAGLSMGGSLALRLAELRPADIHGLLLVNPSVQGDNKLLPLVPVLKHVIKAVPGIASDIRKPGSHELGYDRVPLAALDSLRKAWPVVRINLPSVTCPTLMFRSRTDHVVEPSSGAAIRGSVGNVREIVLEDSYHVATMDNDAPAIFDESVRFLRSLSPVEHS
jgi:carboxylesterase